MYLPSLDISLECGDTEFSLVLELIFFPAIQKTL